MSVITRFAPSPTGFLHIGGVRTALFNYLFAKHHGGKYLVRIEDTDKKRSTPKAVDAIFSGLEWLNLSSDEDTVFQSKNIARHKQVALDLVEQDKAYFCYTTPDELSEARSKAETEGKNFRYDRKWRNTTETPPVGIDGVVRLKCPIDGETTINDLVQGDTTVVNQQLDDYILLRSDGTPTYMLSVVVDDIDMNISHVIRGDDHLSNTFRQIQLYNAIGADIPKFAHIPLIHGPDGKKLSKRHGTLGVDSYQDMGYLPEALKNYLLRLGWSHGDDEIFTEEQAVEWFDMTHIGKSASRMDFQKIENINAHYIREENNDDLLPKVLDILGNIDDIAKKRITTGLSGIKERATTLNDFPKLCEFYISAPTFPLTDEKACKMIKEDSPAILANVVTVLNDIVDWTEKNIESAVKNYIETNELKFGAVAQPIRATLSGTTKSPAIFEMMAVLGKEESLKRLSCLA